MSNRKKIEWLLGELTILSEKGIIARESADALSRHYLTAMPPKINFQQLVFMFVGILSAALIGAGAILIIAHNWDDLPRHVRVAMAFVPLSGAALFGAYALWRDKSPVWREGAALFLALASAASIALMSQTYQLGGTLKDFLFIWLLLFFPLIYIFSSAGVFLLYALAVTVWNFQRINFFGSQTFDGDLLFLLMFAIIPSWWLIISFRQAPYGLKSAMLCWIITIFALLNSIGVLPEGQPVQLRIYWPLLVALLFLAGVACRTRAAGFWRNPMLTAGAAGIVIYAAAASFTDFWTPHRMLRSTQNNWQNELYAWSVIAVMAAGWLPLLLKQRRNWTAWLPGALPVMAAISLPVPAAGAYVFNLYLLIAGLVFIRRGLLKAALFNLNLGMFLLSLLVFLRFVDSELNILLRGILFILFGAMFLLANLMASRKFKKSRRQTRAHKNEP